MISGLGVVVVSWAHQTQHPLYHQLHVMWLRRIWGASAQTKAACLQWWRVVKVSSSPGTALLWGHRVNLACCKPAWVFHVALGTASEVVEETLQLRVPFFYLSDFSFGLYPTCMCSLAGCAVEMSVTQLHA